MLNESQDVINDIKQQVKNQSILRNRSVGLAIVYGGAPDPGSIPQAEQISGKVYNVLRALGREGFAFERASYYAQLYDLGNTPDTVSVDVYLFTP